VAAVDRPQPAQRVPAVPGRRPPHDEPPPRGHRQHLLGRRRACLPFVAPYGAAKAGVENLTRRSRPGSRRSACGSTASAWGDQVRRVPPRHAAHRAGPRRGRGRSNGFGRAGLPRRSRGRSCSSSRRPPASCPARPSTSAGPPRCRGSPPPRVAAMRRPRPVRLARRRARGAPSWTGCDESIPPRLDLLRQARDGLPGHLNAGMLFGEGGFCILGWMLFSAGLHHITLYGNTIGSWTRNRVVPPRTSSRAPTDSPSPTSSPRPAQRPHAELRARGRRRRPPRRPDPNGRAVTLVDGGELMRRALRREGVTHVFGLGGGHINPTCGRSGTTPT